jgi:threonine dehydrogenase-like Zn-dependent dehydrogenase
MKQLVTNKSGALEVVEVPAPRVKPGFVLVRSLYSLISPGTEGSQVREGKAGLITKVREHPDQVRQVLAKVKKEGIRSAASQIKDKLEQWRTLGYSLAGTVIGVGEGVTDLSPGDIVACAGAGHAVHAEVVTVPRNLTAKVPEGVDPRHAAFVTLGAIALHGVRRARPELGESALVVGLGLVGQLAVQLFVVSGVKVAVSDLDPERTRLALELGADIALDPERDPEADISGWTGGFGVDMALVCAASRSSDPVRASARFLRDRGRMVVVGDVGLDLERGPFYSKELDFTLSRSYGPGRYDRAYEEEGVDYPVGYVRWTEGRNLSAVLDLLAKKQICVDGLITQEIPVDKAPEAFERILEGKSGLGTLIQYDPGASPKHIMALAPAAPVEGKAGILLVGAGWFARTYHLPNLASQSNLTLAGVVSGTGANARQIAEKAGASFAGTDLEEGLSQPGVDAVLICTHHHLHVPQIVTAVRAGKHVLVEKPLALDAEGLTAVASALRENPARLAVGFNRRHAPLAQDLKQLFR